MKDERLFKLVGKRIQQLRRKRGLTQDEMTQFGFNYKHYQRIEQGQQNLELATLNKLAQVFKIPIRQIFVFESTVPKKVLSRVQRPTSVSKDRRKKS